MATPDSDTNGIFSLDVQCVATGWRHDDRDVCIVAVVDQNEKVLLKKTVKPENPVVSYLTPLTGVTAGDLDHAPIRLADVIAEVKAVLGPNAVLVGQNVECDIQWLKLEQGVDYKRTVELNEMFKVYNSRYGNFNYFSLAHEANTLLQAGFISNQHDPATDAIAAMKLFNKYHGKQSLIDEAKRKLLSTRRPPPFRKIHNYRYEGVCMAAFMPNKCFCGAPTLRSK